MNNHTWSPSLNRDWVDSADGSSEPGNSADVAPDVGNSAEGLPEVGNSAES
ncbi:hypothetical protein PF010_g23493 [Phytophthora fragariae]|uniref:Uncharacterized protein n=1 Tax=Phytophthora fragariae TaxID=53985 RepID=A0A6G0K682_9STRA|nr:hypothetical protein PF010_g23493 [Phytophthora fragariae]